MRCNSKTLSNPTSNVIDRTFGYRHQQKLEAIEREKVEREVQLMIEGDQREARLVSLFQKLPADKQHDVLAITQVYHEHYGIEDRLAES